MRRRRSMVQWPTTRLIETQFTTARGTATRWSTALGTAKAAAEPVADLSAQVSRKSAIGSAWPSMVPATGGSRAGRMSANGTTRVSTVPATGSNKVR